MRWRNNIHGKVWMMRLALELQDSLWEGMDRAQSCSFPQEAQDWAVGPFSALRMIPEECPGAKACASVHEAPVCPCSLCPPSRGITAIHGILSRAEMLAPAVCGLLGLEEQIQVYKKDGKLPLACEG